MIRMFFQVAKMRGIMSDFDESLKNDVWKYDDISRVLVMNEWRHMQYHFAELTEMVMRAESPRKVDYHDD